MFVMGDNVQNAQKIIKELLNFCLIKKYVRNAH